MIRFVTRDYEYAHARRPRGRGSWAFALKRDYTVDEAIFVPGSLTYGDACHEFARVARMFGVTGPVWVCS